MLPPAVVLAAGVSIQYPWIADYERRCEEAEATNARLIADIDRQREQSEAFAQRLDEMHRRHMAEYAALLEKLEEQHKRHMEARGQAGGSGGKP